MAFPMTAVRSAAAWHGANMSRSDEWIVHLSPTDCDELETAAQALRRQGIGAAEFGTAEFPLPNLAPKLGTLISEVTHGRGFVLLRGLPVARYDDPTLRTIFWGLGCHWGNAITQNKAGDPIAVITDLGLDATKPGVKPSLTNAEQRPHSDPSDVVALLCVRGAMRGGVSRIASTVAIYNRLLEEHPDAMKCLYRGFHHDLRGDAAADVAYGCTPVPIPVYRMFDGVLSSVFNASTVKTAEQLMDVRIPAEEMAMLDRIVELARSDELRLDMVFDPGDIQLLNNFTTVHWRTHYEDYPEPDRKRRLYRLWLNRPGARPVDPAFKRGYITGSLAGVPVRTEACT